MPDRWAIGWRDWKRSSQQGRKRPYSHRLIALLFIQAAVFTKIRDHRALDSALISLGDGVFWSRHSGGDWNARNTTLS
ncbi:hypothetical protein BJX96DRAFT_117219 [Aspergillus floccosus]